MEVLPNDAKNILPSAGLSVLCALIPLQELGNSSGSHFSSSSPMTIDVQLGDISHGLLGSSHLSTINPSELALGLGGDNIGHHSETPEQPLSATPSPAGSLQDEDMDDFKVKGLHLTLMFALMHSGSLV